ncbi:hypothetical protein ACEPAG_2597 [Sanghuangporus baumii]
MSVTVTGLHNAQELRDLFGRGMNSDLYKLPADKQEMDRLSLQHRIWKLMAGELYPKEAENAVQNALHRAKDDLSPPMILDVGSGSGTWAVEMALKFPHAKVIGMDLIQSNPSFVPPNCMFVKADATAGLSDYVGQFDIVQCRSVAKHVPDAQEFARSVGKTVRPGGLFFFADAVTNIYNEKFERYLLAEFKELGSENRLADDDRSWFARWMSEVTERWTTKAQQNTDGDKLHILINEVGQFEDVHQSTYWSPIGWDGENIVTNRTAGAEIGKLMVLNVYDFLQSSKPSLLAAGLSRDVVEIWVKNVQQEAVNPAKHMLMNVLAQTISGRFDCLPAGGFTLCQNLWGANAGVGNQNSTLISTTSDTISWETVWTWANNENSVKSYANVESLTAKGVQLSNIASAPTSWRWTYKTQSSGIRADVSYDIWLGPASSGTPASSASAYEVMIWLSGKGGIQPVGSQTTTGISLAGHNWNLWKGPNSNWQVLSFVSADGDITEFEADLNEFFEYLVSNQGVSSSQFLQSIQTGTEPFTGSADLLTNSYSVSVSSK